MNTNKIFLVLALISITFASAQVGIGTKNPQGIFNIDGGKDNAATGTPTASQQLNDFTVLSDGRVGLGTTAPNVNSILDLVSSDKGILIPRVALVGTDISAPLVDHVEGMLVYNTTLSIPGGTNYNPSVAVQQGFYYNDGTQWILLITKSNLASTRSGDLDLEGDRILNASSIGSAAFFIYDKARHPYFGGTTPDALTVLERELNKTFVTDGTGSRLFTITNADFDVDGDPDFANMGKVGIGTTAPGSILDIASTTGSITNTRYTASNTLGANLILQKSFNNTNLTNTAVPSGDIIGRIVWKSNTGAGFNSASSAEMRAEQVGIASATNNGSKIVFATTAQNATNFLDRMTIDSNGNVGIGTTNPDRILSVVQAGNGTAFISNASTNLMQFESTANSSSIGHFFKAKNAVGTVKEIVTGINPNTNSNNGVFFIGIGTGAELLGFDLVNYNSYVSTIAGSKFGIGTKNPATKLEVNGAATNTTSISRTDSAIDFSASNLAGTTASAGAFTLTNLKDGGAYTLAVKGTTVGTCSFTATNIAGTALTVHLPTGHGATTSGKHTLYNFIVIGTDVYVTWMAGL